MRILEIAQTRVWYGCRKILVLMNREDWKVGNPWWNESIGKED